MSPPSPRRGERGSQPADPPCRVRAGRSNRRRPPATRRQRAPGPRNAARRRNVPPGPMQVAQLPSRRARARPSPSPRPIDCVTRRASCPARAAPPCEAEALVQATSRGVVGEDAEMDPLAALVETVDHGRRRHVAGPSPDPRAVSSAPIDERYEIPSNVARRATATGIAVAAYQVVHEARVRERRHGLGDDPGRRSSSDAESGEEDGRRSIRPAASAAGPARPRSRSQRRPRVERGPTEGGPCRPRRPERRAAARRRRPRSRWRRVARRGRPARRAAAASRSAAAGRSTRTARRSRRAAGRRPSRRRASRIASTRFQNGSASTRIVEQQRIAEIAERAARDRMDLGLVAEQPAHGRGVDPRMSRRPRAHETARPAARTVRHDPSRRHPDSGDRRRHAMSRTDSACGRRPRCLIVAACSAAAQPRPRRRRPRASAPASRPAESAAAAGSGCGRRWRRVRAVDRDRHGRGDDRRTSRSARRPSRPRSVTSSRGPTTTRTGHTATFNDDPACTTETIAARRHGRHRVQRCWHVRLLLQDPFAHDRQSGTADDGDHRRSTAARQAGRSARNTEAPDGRSIDRRLWQPGVTRTRRGTARASPAPFPGTARRAAPRR